VEDGRAPVLQILVVGQQRVDRHLGGHPDVAQGVVAVLPLGDVQQPLRTAQVLKQIGKLRQQINQRLIYNFPERLNLRIT